MIQSGHRSDDGVVQFHRSIVIRIMIQIGRTNDKLFFQDSGQGAAELSDFPFLLEAEIDRNRDDPDIGTHFLQKRDLHLPGMFLPVSLLVTSRKQRAIW